MTIFAFGRLPNGKNIIAHTLYEQLHRKYTIPNVLIVINEDQWHQILNWGSCKHLYRSCKEARHLEADHVDEIHVADIF